MTLRTNRFTDRCGKKGGDRRAGRSAPVQRRFAAILVALSSAVVSPAGAAKPDPQPSVVVQRGLLRIVVHASGVVAAGLDVPIHARASGEIISLPVELGTSVKKGQLLLEIEPGEYARRLALAQADDLESSAQLRLARTRLAKGRRDFERATTEAQSGLDAAREVLRAAQTEFQRVDRRHKDKQASEQQWREAQAAVDAARTAETKALRQWEEVAATSLTVELQRQEVTLREAVATRTKATLDAARADLSKTRLVSPIDGVVTELSVVRGGVIAPAAVEISLPTMTVSDLSNIAVTAEIDEERIRDIQPNLAASISLPAYPERAFLGRIVSIAPRGHKRGDKTVFPIRIVIDGDPGDAARPGLTANITIVAIEKPDALLLDNRAIQTAGSQSRVSLLEQGKPPQERTVKLGRSDGTRTEILEGLKEGDRVALPQPVSP